MGKIRTRTLGVEEIEEQQKDQQKKKSQEKKMQKKPSKAVEAVIEAETKDKIESTEGADGKEVKKEVKDEKKSTKIAKAHVRGKKYTASVKKIDKKKTYSLNETIPLLKKIHFAKFDESIELHLNVDEEGLKGEVTLPHATGKTVRVALVDDKLLDKLEKGVIDFDVLVTHPSFMPKLAKFARVLGPKGLMPNPKAGTITPNPEEAMKKFSGGTLRWKTEPKAALIHQMIGKSSHDDKMLVENAQAFLLSVGKPHIKAVFIKTTMSPSLKVNMESI